MRTTIVGCGAVARGLYRQPLVALEKRGILRVVGLVDRDPVHAQAMRSFFPKALVSSDVIEALEEVDSELTLVLSPAHLHAEHATIALRRGNHVLCEKPMAATQEQCRAMVAAARQAQRVLAVGMIRRFFPAFATLKQLIEQGTLGTLESFRYREGKVFDWEVTTPAAFTTTRGGGVLLDIGPHALDFLTWLFGAPQVLSHADDALGGVDSNALMRLRTPACSGTVQLSWDSPLRSEMRIIGSKAEAVLRLDEFDRLALRHGSQYLEQPCQPRFAGDLERPSRSSVCPRTYAQSVFCQLVQVVRAIRLGEAPAVDGDAGLACVAVLEAARRVAQPLEMAWLNPGQRQRQLVLHGAHA